MSKVAGTLRVPSAVCILSSTVLQRTARGACLLLFLLAAGCGKQREYLEDEYGQRNGIGAAQSVNGTAVFADMVAQAGHRVTSWRVLSPRLNKADCIVWIPDDFRPPEAPVIKWLEKWLSDKSKSNRTLIYVGRDFDAAAWYWRQLEQNAPANEKASLANHAAIADEAFKGERKHHGNRTGCKWFDFDWDAEHRKVESLRGLEVWSDNVDAKNAAIELNNRLLSTDSDCDVLLGSGDDMLVGRQRVGRGQLYIVANGSFLLNAMLVNHEHRKLAGKLIEEIGSPGKNVVFVESRPSMFKIGDFKKLKEKAKKKRSAAAVDSDPSSGDTDDEETSPPIRNDDPATSPPSGLEIADVWPTNWILLHFAAIGIIFCFWKLPVFGRPRAPDPSEASDFGKHIDAVAAMLKRSGDTKYARSRIDHYQQILKKSD